MRGTYVFYLDVFNFTRISSSCYSSDCDDGTGVGLHARKSLGTGQGLLSQLAEFLCDFFETIMEFITELADSVIGSHGRAYVPLFASLFTLILINNLTGILLSCSSTRT